ncbi:major facilitator superfamily domain-containing protein 4A [Trichonephila clavata]|uniref:Major facilitator superfamily domain-containing protein 4A n=1 Tax=Trichonephila clavata TaxID=2740835 RepID=A0A8X6L0H1_TRICU|nr:major facilitator superfamily domain-containing protein 4A [Trichonephila clavata]
MLIVGTTMMTVSMASIPLCNALWALAIVLAVMGFFMGTIDTVANVSMICIYGKDVSPFLQAIHFFYGVGAFLSPMIAQPFLLNEDCSPFISNETIVLFTYDNETLPASTLAEARAMTHIDYAFLIMALTMVPVVILTFTLLGRKHCLRLLGGAPPNREEKQNKEYESMEESDGRSDSDRIPKNMAQIIVVTVLSAILMFLYDGLQAAYGGYIYSYAVKGPVKFRKSDAAYLNALFWGMFAAGRLLSIALATKLSPSFMLFCNIIGCTGALLLMLALRYNHVMLIIGTCLLGIFMSSVFPTTLSLTEQYIHVTPSTTSFLVFGAAVGEMSMPVIIGHEFYRAGPTSLLVIGMVLCFVSIIAYMTLWLVGLTLLKPDSNCFCKRQSNQQQSEVEYGKFIH